MATKTRLSPSRSTTPTALTKRTAIKTSQHSLVKKPRGGFHPAAVKNSYPQYRFWEKDHGDHHSYDGLTDNSPMREYAWAFLRRNRFFQLDQDLSQPGHDVSEWGFRITPEWEASSGINSKTPYWFPDHYPNQKKPKSVETPAVRWQIVEHLRDQINAHGKLARSPKNVPIDAEQTAIVFELSNVCGPIAAINLQLDMARETLLKSADEPRTKYLNAQKSHLRVLLRIVDWFSSKEYQDITSVAKLLRGYKKAASKGIAPSRSGDPTKADHNSVTQLATEAFRYVYEGELFKLLDLDPWPWKD